MATHAGSIDRTNLVVLEPAITRAYWSRVRAWNGSDVLLSFETRWVPDGTPATIRIFEDDSGEGSDDDFIEELPAGAKVVNGRCTVAHTLRWDDAVLGAERATEGAELEFYFLVRIERFNIEARSGLLYVDLGGLEVSR